MVVLLLADFWFGRHARAASVASKGLCIRLVAAGGASDPTISLCGLKRGGALKNLLLIWLVMSSSSTTTTSDADMASSSGETPGQLIGPVSAESAEGGNKIQANGPAASLEVTARGRDGCDQASQPTENGTDIIEILRPDASEVPPGESSSDTNNSKENQSESNEKMIGTAQHIETPTANGGCPELAEALASFEHDDNDDEEDLLMNISEVESNELIDDDEVGDVDMETNSRSDGSGGQQQQQDISPTTIKENKSKELRVQQHAEGTNEDGANIDPAVELTGSSSPQPSPPPSSPVAEPRVEEAEDTSEPAESISNITAVNYPTALQKTLQLMAETDINTTEYTPTNSMDMRYRGPSASHPQRMPALSSLPAMFSESQPALFDLGQQGGGGGGGNRSRVNSHIRSSPRGDGSDAGSGTSGIIYEETDDEEDEGQASKSSPSSAEHGHSGDAGLEERIDVLERMVTRLTDLLMAQKQERQNGTTANGDAAISPVAAEAAATAAIMSGTPGAITATPARTLEHEEATPPSATETPAAPDLAHSNVLPLDSPSPSPRRRTVQTADSKDAADREKAGGNIDGIPSPPRLSDTGKPPLATPAIDGNTALHDATPAQPTPDLEYRSYSQEHVDALRRRREAGARRSYSFDVAEQLEREISQEAVKATPLSTVRKSGRKPRLSPVPPSPIVPAIDKDTQTDEADNGESKQKKSDEVPKSTLTPTLAPRPHSGRLDGKAPPNKMDMPTLDLDNKNEKKPRKKSDDRSKAKSGDKAKPPSRSNSSASLSSKVRSTSIASSKDGTVPSGASPPRPKKSSSSRKLKSSAPPSSIKTTPLKHKESSDILEKKQQTSSSPSKSLKSPEVPGRQSMMTYIKKEMMIDSSRQEGSAADDVDANMEEFLRVPAKLEKLLFFSFWICMDAFLYALTILPIKFLWSCICLAASIIRPRKGFGVCSFHRRHLYQILQMSVVIVVYQKILMPISIGVLYHWIRGQAMLKLYVLIAIVEVFDRLLCSIGQDALDSLYWNCNRRPYHPRMIISTTVVLIYATFHSLLLFLHVATLNVAMNSSDHALLSLIISGNFAEIKSTVFKKYNKQNLFKITTSDICERFKLALFLVLILILNCFQGGMNQAKILQYFYICGVVLVAELFSDWIKHSFITKFNFIKSSVYPDYALILAGDLTGIGHEGINLNHTHAVVKRLGFSQIPIVCVMLRFLSEAMRYAIVFSHGDAGPEYFFNTFAFWYTEGRWATLTGAMIGVFFLTLVVKVVLGFALLGVARRMLEGPADDIGQGGMSGKQEVAPAAVATGTKVSAVATK